MGLERERDEAEEEDQGFPSGPWVGYYTYGLAPRSGFHQMDLDLAFRTGHITGDGMDSVGRFLISGIYDRESRQCSWTKSYLGKHMVRYEGVQSGKTIQGSWVISARHRGGFAIWPGGEGALTGEFFVSEEAEAPTPGAALTVALPQAQPSLT